MARIPRLYRVESHHRDTTTDTRHYQTPAAAQARAESFELADPFAQVVITPSHPITYPRPAGDLTPLDIPDTLVSRALVDAFLLELGVLPAAVQLVIVSDAELVVEYQPDPTGKRAPKQWRASITE